MKVSLSNILSVLFLTMMMVLMVCSLNAFTTINKANDYHNTSIAEMEASNFSTSVVEKYTKSEGPFKTTIIDRTAMNKDTNLERVGRIYEVTTKYTIKIPIINFKIDKSIQGFAR